MSKFEDNASSPSEEPAVPSDNGSDGPSRLENPEYRGSAAPLLRRPALARAPNDGDADREDSVPSRPHILPQGSRRVAYSTVSDNESPDRAIRRRRAGWARLGLAVISSALGLALVLAAITVAMTFAMRFAAPNHSDGETKTTELDLRPVNSNVASPAPFAEPPPPVIAVRPDAKAPSVPMEPERDARSTEVARPSRDRDATAAAPAALASLPAVVAERSDTKLESELALLPEAMPPRVLIRYLGSSPEARRRAEAVARALGENGVEVADVRESASAVRNELSFSYAPDEAIAQQVGRVAGISPTRSSLSKDGLMARPGMVELSISGR